MTTDQEPTVDTINKTRRAFAAGALTAIVAGTAIAAPAAFASGSDAGRAPATAIRAAPVADADFGDLTLDQLADELSELGLEVTISPADDVEPGDHGDVDSGDDGLDAFYQQHKDDFVTDYAASNPAEDLAETFAVFVTEDRPTGDTIADQKVELLWNDPAMIQLRDQIRANL